MTEAISPRSEPTPRLRGLIASILSVSIVGFGISVSYPLFAVLMERMGISGAGVGLSASAVAVGMLTAGVIIPRILLRVGLMKILLWALAATGLVILLAPVWPNFWSWVVLRFFFGVSVTAVFYASELWIVTAAPAARRGAWLGIYGTFLSLGFFAGPVVLGSVGTDGWAPFLISAVILTSAAFPIWLARNAAPELIEEEPTRLSHVLGFFRSDPTLVFAVTLFAAVEFGAMGLISVWGLRSGLNEPDAIRLLAMFALGNMCLQVPLGLLSDRMSRMILIAICALSVVVFGLAMPILAGQALPLYVLTFAAGGLTGGLYLLPLAEFGERYSGTALARANGAIIFCYGLGALFAPTVFGAAMDLIPPHGLAYGMLAAALAFLCLWLFRRFQSSAT